ncbi:MAG: biotin/lipoyl-binding protein [Flavobacteriales bacterium]|nr:biotin/lipoyl-binding protein [Flavobacteriales bacterium]
MYQIETEGKKFEIEFGPTGTSSGEINGTPFDIDIQEIGKGEFHIIRNNKSYQAQLIKFDVDHKTLEIRIDGHKYKLQVKDRYDVLLDKLGFGGLNSAKAKDLVAPMPGLVLEVKVKSGDKIKKGDPLIILEAMKMENILKATTDAIIDNCSAKKGDSVEKNEKLISFKS